MHLTYFQGMIVVNDISQVSQPDIVASNGLIHRVTVVISPVGVTHVPFFCNVALGSRLQWVSLCISQSGVIRIRVGEFMHITRRFHPD